MCPPSDSNHIKELFGKIAARYDAANHVLSGGLDYFWRQKAVRLIKAWQPSRILDLATGSGDLAISLRATCPSTVVVGADFCRPMLAQARSKGFTNLIVADALQTPFKDATFEVVVVAFGLRNMVSLTRALTEMARVLRPGGHLLVLDFSLPRPALLRPYRLYLHHVLPRVAAWLTGEKAAYDYLGASIEGFPCGAAMCDLIECAGFAGVSCEPLTGGIASLYAAERLSGRVTEAIRAGEPDLAERPESGRRV